MCFDIVLGALVFARFLLLLLAFVFLVFDGCYVGLLRLGFVGVVLCYLLCLIYLFGFRCLFGCLFVLVICFVTLFCRYIVWLVV